MSLSIKNKNNRESERRREKGEEWSPIMGRTKNEQGEVIRNDASVANLMI